MTNSDDWTRQRIAAALMADPPHITVDDGLWLLARLAPSLAPPEPAQSLRLAIIHLRSAIENTERGRVYGVLHDAAVGVVNACPTIAGCLAAPPEPEAAPPQDEWLIDVLTDYIELRRWCQIEDDDANFPMLNRPEISKSDVEAYIARLASSSRSGTPRTKTE